MYQTRARGVRASALHPFAPSPVDTITQSSPGDKMAEMDASVGPGCGLARVSLSLQLLRNRPDLCLNLVLLERVGSLDVGEADSLAPTAVEDLARRRDAITVVRFGVQRDLQKDLGKEGG